MEITTLDSTLDRGLTVHTDCVLSDRSVPRSVLGKLLALSCDIDDCLSCVASLLALILTTLTAEENRIKVLSEVNPNAPPRLFFIGSAFTVELLAECIHTALNMIQKCVCDDDGCFECIKSRYESVSLKPHVIEVLSALSTKSAKLELSQDLTL